MARNKSPRSVRPRTDHDHPPYPGVQAPVDPSRRRFLRQLAAGSGAVGLAAGGVGVVGAQTAPESDFGVLEAHEPIAVEPSEDVTTAPRRRSARREEGAEREQAREDMDSPPVADVWLTEDRALWVEPGYLVLLRWRRPDGDERPISGLEGAFEAVGAYLEVAVTDGATQLHDVDELAVLEQGIVGVLGPIVVPAAIEVLHLDHDCNIVCPAPVVEHPMVRGRMVSPRR